MPLYRPLMHFVKASVDREIAELKAKGIDDHHIELYLDDDKYIHCRELKEKNELPKHDDVLPG